jgi:hypothetical protein
MYGTVNRIDLDRSRHIEAGLFEAKRQSTCPGE